MPLSTAWKGAVVRWWMPFFVVKSSNSVPLKAAPLPDYGLWGVPNVGKIEQNSVFVVADVQGRWARRLFISNEHQI